LACKPFEHYPESNLYKNCRNLQEFTNNVTNNSVNYLREQSYNRGFRPLKRLYYSATDLKDTLFSSLDDFYFNLKKTFRRKVGDVKDRVTGAVVSTKDNAKEYCDAGLQKVNDLIEDLKREKAKFLGDGHALKPYQEQELEAVSNRTCYGGVFLLNKTRSRKE
jgi:hypothetical protein